MTVIMCAYKQIETRRWHDYTPPAAHKYTRRVAAALKINTKNVHTYLERWCFFFVTEADTYMWPSGEKRTVLLIESHTSRRVTQGIIADEIHYDEKTADGYIYTHRCIQDTNILRATLDAMPVHPRRLIDIAARCIRYNPNFYETFASKLVSGGCFNSPIQGVVFPGLHRTITELWPRWYKNKDTYECKFEDGGSLGCILMKERLCDLKLGIIRATIPQINSVFDKVFTAYINKKLQSKLAVNIRDGGVYTGISIGNAEYLKGIQKQQRAYYNDGNAPYPPCVQERFTSPEKFDNTSRWQLAYIIRTYAQLTLCPKKQLYKAVYEILINRGERVRVYDMKQQLKQTQYDRFPCVRRNQKSAISCVYGASETGISTCANYMKSNIEHLDITSITPSKMWALSKRTV